MFVRITVVDIRYVVVSDVELYEVIDKLSFDIFVWFFFFQFCLVEKKKMRNMVIVNINKIREEVHC